MIREGWGLIRGAPGCLKSVFNVNITVLAAAFAHAAVSHVAERVNSHGERSSVEVREWRNMAIVAGLIGVSCCGSGRWKKNQQVWPLPSAPAFLHCNGNAFLSKCAALYAVELNLATFVSIVTEKGFSSRLKKNWVAFIISMDTGHRDTYKK